MNARTKRGVMHAPAQRADLRTLHPAGHDPNVPDRAALRLARAIHCAESTACAVSWSAQERAERYYNANGLGATLDEAARLEDSARLETTASEGAKMILQPDFFKKEA